MLARMRLHAVVAVGIALGCSKSRKEPAPVAVAPSVVAPSVSAAPSASAVASSAPTIPAPPSNPTPPLLRRVSPKQLTASSFSQDKGKWSPQLASDRSRSTAWRAGGDAPQWIEATFDKPIKLWAVRSDAGWLRRDDWDTSAHAKSVTLRLGERDAYRLELDADARTASFLGLAEQVSTVRLTYEAAYAGKGPLAVSEIAFYVDATDAPSVPRSILEKEIAAAESAADAKAILLRFGVVPRGELDSAKVKLTDLDGLFAVLEARFVRLGGEYAVYVFLGNQVKDGQGRFLALDSETIDVAHADEFAMVTSGNHVAVSWTVTRDDKPALHGLRAFSVDRSAVEKTADLLEENEIKVAPKEGRFSITVGDKELPFDDKAYAYW